MLPFIFRVILYELAYGFRKPAIPGEIGENRGDQGLAHNGESQSLHPSKIMVEVCLNTVEPFNEGRFVWEAFTDTGGFLHLPRKVERELGMPCFVSGYLERILPHGNWKV